MLSSRAISGMWKRKGAEMLREDLKSARINFKRVSGEVIDFHGLRHTYVTMLAQAGVMPAQLKRLMRHSNVQLTMDYYTPYHLTTSMMRLPRSQVPKLRVQINVLYLIK